MRKRRERTRVFFMARIRVNFNMHRENPSTKANSRGKSGSEEAEASDSPDGDESPDHGSDRRPVLLEEGGEGDENEGTRGDDGQDDSAIRGFE